MKPKVNTSTNPTQFNFFCKLFIHDFIFVEKINIIKMVLWKLLHNLIAWPKKVFSKTPIV
jgi:hypothetical protein